MEKNILQALSVRPSSTIYAALPHSGPSSYTFVEHRRYLGALLDLLGIHQRVTFDDWESALGFEVYRELPKTILL